MPPQPVPSPFEVIITSGLDLDFGAGDLTSEVVSAKAAFMYGDSIRIESFRPAFLIARLVMQMRTLKERFGPTVEALSAAEVDEFNAMLDERLRDRPVNRFPELSLVDLLELPEVLAELLQDHDLAAHDWSCWFADCAEIAAKWWVAFKPDVRPAAALVAAREMGELVRTGAVQVDVDGAASLVAAPAESLVDRREALFATLLNRLSDSSRVAAPLLPERARPERKPALSETRRALAEHLLVSLPNFADAPVDELVDIRSEVRGSLASFRAALIDFEKQINDSGPHPDLASAIAELRLSTIDPELEALNASLADLKALPTIARSMPLSGAGLLGLAATAAIGAPVLQVQPPQPQVSLAPRVKNTSSDGSWRPNVVAIACSYSTRLRCARARSHCQVELVSRPGDACWGGSVAVL